MTDKPGMHEWVTCVCGGAPGLCSVGRDAEPFEIIQRITEMINQGFLQPRLLLRSSEYDALRSKGNTVRVSDGDGAVAALGSCRLYVECL